MTESDNPDGLTSETALRPLRVRFGMALMVVSGALWFSLFAIPFLPLTIGQKTLLGGAVFAGVQITWWSGVALAGRSMVKKLTSWFRK